MDRGDWKRAEALLARAVEASCVDVDAKRQYAEALWHRGALDEALTQLEEARRLVDTDPSLAVRAGEVYQAIGQPGRAKAMADEALRLAPKFAPAWALHGSVAEAAGQPRQALANYQRALGYDPQNQVVAIQVAETYRQLNEPERALMTLQSVADRCPPGDEPQRVLYLQGLALVALGRHDDAARCLSHAATVDQPSPEILCALAEAQLLSGNVASAQSCVQQALALNPNHAASRALSTRMATAVGPGQPLSR
jgi:tetratricopeptide (TPR) repeat protein